MSILSRRRFLLDSGMASGTLFLSDSLTEGLKKKAKKTTAATSFVRKNIDSLADAELAVLRNGVQVMKDRPETDPTSWWFQANIHGTFTSDPAWNKCEHWTYFFLSWHRMYLYFFERILRAASGDPNLTVPYWNYGNPASRALPVAFRQPSDPTNSLYVSQRSSAINGGANLPAADTSHAAAFSEIDFGANNSVTGFTNILEGSPHGAVHVKIGGWMGDTRTAARDPIFWLHHANIDRLWNLWLAQGAGRHSPTADNVWGGTKFTFFDEYGDQVEITGCQILRAGAQLGYTYQEEPPQVAEICIPILNIPEYLVVDIFVHPQDPVTILTDRPVAIVLPVDSQSMSNLHQSAAAGKKIVLRLEGLETDAPVSVTFEIYLNLPSDVTSIDHRSIHYVGNLSFFGVGAGQHLHHGGHKRSFNVTKVYNTLRERNLWNERQLSLTFIPRGLISSRGEPLPISVDGRPRFSQISVVSEELKER